MDQKVREAIRYLGYGTHAIDEPTYNMIQESFKELEKLVDVKFVYRIFEIVRCDESVMEIGGIRIQSKDLKKNLSGCEKAALFAVTLGTQVDMLLRRYEIVNIAKAVVFQACAAALLEEHCDAIQRRVAKKTRPRFSPGYGDFSILHQQDFLCVLDTPRKIGMSYTEAKMLIPTKSVTAVIGIEKE